MQVICFLLLKLKKEFGASIFPPFPPKKLLPLTPAQVDERRLELEHYIQQGMQFIYVQMSMISNWNMSIISEHLTVGSSGGNGGDDGGDSSAPVLVNYHIREIVCFL